MVFLQKVLVAPALAALATASPSTPDFSFDCRPPGPIVPKATSLANHPAFQTATAQLTRQLQLATNKSIKAGWAVDNTSFSIGVISLDSATPIWEYHHLAPNNVRGTKNISRDSEYLIGSISKVITDYLMLKSGVNPDDPITKYIPKLDNSTSLIKWKEITLRHLADQLAGIPPNCKY